MANWSNPLLTSTYTNFVTEVKDRDVDLALQFDGTTSTNIPTNTIRWNSSISRWQKWSGSAWGELTSTYALNALSVSGTTSLGTATATTVATADNSTNIATTAFVKNQGYLTSVGSYLPLSGGTISGNLSISGTLTANTGFVSSNINGGPFGFKNKVINGDFAVDQYNAPATLLNPLANATCFTDRWNFTSASTVTLKGQRNYNSGTIGFPAYFNSFFGFENNTAVTLSASENVGIQHRIEGNSVANWQWGLATSRDAYLSFWVRTSVSGTYGISIQNNANDQSFVTSYTIAAGAVNTWTKIAIKIASPTTGTFLKDTGLGIRIRFSLGCGTTFQTGTTNAWQSGNFHAPTGAVSWVGIAGATWYLTGVQLEDSEQTGSIATDFEDPPFATKLALCQRFFEKSYSYDVVPGTVTADGALAARTVLASETSSFFNIGFAVPKRLPPTVQWYSPVTGTIGRIRDVTNGADITVTGIPTTTGISSANVGGVTHAATGAAGDLHTTHFTASSEL